MAFVVDNSVVCGWFVSNQATDYSEAVALRLLEELAYAPALWQLEFANVLRSACKRGALGVQARMKSSARLVPCRSRLTATRRVWRQFCLWPYAMT